MTQEQKIIRANDCARRFYRVAFRKRIYYAIEELQATWECNKRRPPRAAGALATPSLTSNSDDPAGEIGLRLQVASLTVCSRNTEMNVGRYWSRGQAGVC